MSSPEILRDASLQEENVEEQWRPLDPLKSAEPENLEVEKPKIRIDTPWPSHTESKIQSTIGSILKSEEYQSEFRDVGFLTPQQLDFSLLASPSMTESEVSLDLTNPQLCNGEVPPNTPNMSNLDEELTKKAKQQEDNLKEHLEKLAPQSDLQRLGKKIKPKQLDFSLRTPCLTENQAPPNTPILANLEDLAQKISPNLDLDFSLSSSSGYPTSSMSEIGITPNSSSIDSIEEQLIRVAQKQEANLKEDGEKVESIQETEKRAVRISIDPYPRTLSNPNKEKERKKRQNKGLEALKILVPGLKPKSSEIEVCERTIKYIEFMKSQVGPEVDKEFLLNQIF